MPLSPYVAGIRARIGHDLLLLPTVSAAVFDAEGRILMARHTDDGRWSPIGGGLEPDEDPAEAVVREVAEEVGLAVVVDGLVGVYGGPEFRMTYPSGDRVAIVSTFYGCHPIGPAAGVERDDEVAQVLWCTLPEALALPGRPRRTDRTLPDAFAWLDQHGAGDGEPGAH